MAIDKSIDLIGAKERMNALTTDVSPEDDEIKLWEQCWELEPQLTPKDKKIAAALYLHSLLKDKHREKVSSLEKRAQCKSAKALKQGMSDAREQLISTMRMAVQAHSASIEMVVDAKLLRATFSLSTGEKVTWGKATIEQHEDCIENLMQSSRGNVETAARHWVVVNDIKKAKKTCLADL